MYLLLDSNVTAGYYLPRSLSSRRAALRIGNILDCVRQRRSNHFLYIPNFCIAEVFSVFMKHAFGQWNPHVRKRGTIDRRVYESLVRQFQKDIHNGKLLYQYELSRYHVLAVGLVAPIDHHFQITRGSARRHVPMGTFDHLIVAMGIHPAHIHGRDNVAVISADDPLTSILAKCKSDVKTSIVKKLKLGLAEQITGRPFGPQLFPNHLNLKSATKAQMRAILGESPEDVSTPKKVYRWLN